MERKLTVEDARQSLAAHAAEKGVELREKYGPHIGWNELRRILEDRSVVRYPCEIVFDASGLLEGGFKIHLHPLFMTQLAQVPLLVLYQLVLVNYGEFASADDAESFGAAALGIDKEQYYESLCELADQLGGASSP